MLSECLEQSLRPHLPLPTATAAGARTTEAAGEGAAAAAGGHASPAARRGEAAGGAGAGTAPPVHTGTHPLLPWPPRLLLLPASPAPQYPFPFLFLPLDSSYLFQLHSFSLFSPTLQPPTLAPCPPPVSVPSFPISLPIPYFSPLHFPSWVLHPGFRLIPCPLLGSSHLRPLYCSSLLSSSSSPH